MPCGNDSSSPLLRYDKVEARVYIVWLPCLHSDGQQVA